MNIVRLKGYVTASNVIDRFITHLKKSKNSNVRTEFTDKKITTTLDLPTVLIRANKCTFGCRLIV